MKSLILVLAFLALLNSRLLLPSDLHKYFRKSTQQNLQVETNCNVVKAQDLGLKDGQVVYAGYMNTQAGTNSALAYIFYGSQQAKSAQELSNYPTIIWLNGGPGSSSQLGNFLELGPRLFGVDGKQADNPHSWNSLYNVMFVDQPAGTGYSYFDSKENIPKNQDEVGAQFVYAWSQFLTADKGCVKSQSLDGLTKSSWFVFGESYAGKYVPAIAQTVLRLTDLQIPLKGVGIGDGFTDPLVIMQELSSFGFNMGLIDYQERQIAEKSAINGAFSIAKGEWIQAEKDFYETLGTITVSSGDVNVYDIFTFDKYDTLENYVQQYLNNKDTKKTFGFLEEIEYSVSSGDVQESLLNDFMKSDCVARVEEVLKHIPVIIYNGQSDLIVPNPGTLRWVYNLKYENSAEFQTTDFELWTIQNPVTKKDIVAGYKKKAGNLEFRIVNQAGHLVPMSQPVSALDMVASFVDAHK